ncbi:MAG: CPBP family intramembrane metalloprotease [Lachnospiraceae bacterium]|nr:CPBP family intramembrane metalloprotease [Lachnospiraceae bacterium]
METYRYPEIQEEKKPKKPGKIATVLFCLWVVVAMLLVQAAAMYVGIIPKALQLIRELGPNPDMVTKRLEEYMSGSSVMTVLMFASEVICITVAGIWYYRGYIKKDKENRTYRPFNKKFGRIKSVAFVVCGCIAAWSFAVIIQSVISSILPKTAENVGQMLESALGGDMVLGLIAAVILAPIFEEITMRGIILQRSKRAFGVVGCMVISAVLFGVFHMNIIQGLYVLPLGLFWGFVGYRFNSVIPCVVCHMLNNFLGVLIPSFVNPVVLFAVTGSITAFMGVRFGFFSFDKEAEIDE